MTAGQILVAARQHAGLTQQELAIRGGTSQATLSAYEAGRKDPAASVFLRLLAAAGARPELVAAEAPVRVPNRAERERRGRDLVEVLKLAEALPFRPTPTLTYPPIARLASRGR